MVPLSLSGLKAESTLCLAKQLLSHRLKQRALPGMTGALSASRRGQNNSPKARLDLPVVRCSPSKLRMELLFGSTKWNSTCDISALPAGRRLNLNIQFPLLLA